jgi:hypothetical protein
MRIYKGHEISYSRPEWLEVGHPGNRGVVRGDVEQPCPSRRVAYLRPKKRLNTIAKEWIDNRECGQTRSYVFEFVCGRCSTE